MDGTNVDIPEEVKELVSLKVSVLEVDGELIPDSIIVTHDDVTIEMWNVLMQAYDDTNWKLQKTAQDIQKELEEEAEGI